MPNIPIYATIPLMLGKLKALRTNENILIAVDALLYSKSAFLSTFLMTYMIRLSLSNSSSGYIVYKLATYAVMIVLAAALIHFIKKYPLAAWRLGILFSIAQIAVIVLFHSYTDIFPYILAFVTGLESILYYRPYIFFCITEVRNDRRLHFQSVKQVVNEVVKIVTPIIIGFLITDNGYLHTAIFILVICLVQLFLSILFRPSREISLPEHHVRTVLHQIAKHRSIRRLFLLQLFRGALISGSAFLIVPTILVYNQTGSDLDLGLYASVGALIAIALILLFRQFARYKAFVRSFLVFMIPLVILVPLFLILAPSATAVVILFIFSAAVFEGFFNVLLTTRILSSLKKHLGENAFTLEIESVGETFLCIGRVISLAALLATISISGTLYLPHFMLASAILIVPIIILVYSRRGDRLEPPTL